MSLVGITYFWISQKAWCSIFCSLSDIGHLEFGKNSSLVLFHAQFHHICRYLVTLQILKKSLKMLIFFHIKFCLAAQIWAHNGSQGNTAEIRMEGI